MIHATIPQAVYDEVGCTYPVTYVFSIPPGSTGLSARSHGLGEAWRALPTRVRADIFSGELAVRFDYPANRAYVSTVFGPNSPEVWVKVVDATGSDVGTFLEVPPYYDDRDAACALTYDDWDGPDHFVQTALVRAHAERGLWSSIGVNGSTISVGQWADMNGLINTIGHFEPINHGHTHAAPDAYGTHGMTAQEFAAIEIGLGRQSILDNVVMPWQSRRGATQFVAAWIRPYNQTTPDARAVLVAQDYLVERTTGGGGTQAYKALAADGMYEPVIPSSSVSAVSGWATATSQFDTAIAAGGIYIGYGYARDHDWTTPSSPALAFLDHIAGDPDVWYVGYGHLYQYHHAAQNVTVTEGERIVMGYELFARVAGAPVLVAEPVGAVENHNADPDAHPDLFEPAISRTAADVGDVPALQADGSLAFATPSSGGGGLWTLLDSFTLGADTTSFDVTGLALHDLIRVTLVDLRRATAGGSEGLMVRVNGDTTAAYNWAQRSQTKAPTSAVSEVATHSGTSLVTSARVGEFYSGTGWNRSQITATLRSGNAHFTGESNGNESGTVGNWRNVAGWTGTGAVSSLTFFTANGGVHIFESGLRVFVEAHA